MNEPQAYLLRKKAERGLSDAEMAEEMGITRQYLWYLLGGHRPMTIRLARRLRHVYPELLIMMVRELTAPEPMSVGAAS